MPGPRTPGRHVVVSDVGREPFDFVIICVDMASTSAASIVRLLRDQHWHAFDRLTHNAENPYSATGQDPDHIKGTSPPREWIAESPYSYVLEE